MYRLGKSYANKYLVMYILENHTERNRIGISVSKKVGNSVIRHHLTRLIRESYRLQEDMFHSGWDIVIIARASAKRGWVSSDRECFDASWRSSQNNEKEDGIILKKF